MEKINVDHGALLDGIIAPVVSCSALLHLRSIRVELPAVMLTPDGRVDFGYIRSRLVTAGACSIHNVGEIPFPRVVELFEYWKTNPPTHELLAKAMQVFRVPDRTAGRTQMIYQGVRSGKTRGRRSNPERRAAIQNAILTHGEAWRDHLDEIFEELERQEVPIGDLQSQKIDLDDGQTIRVSKWTDLAFADGEQRRQFQDALRKYIV